MRLEQEVPEYDVGVIVGRFQVPDLHDAHKAIIQTVCDKHDKVIIFLGLSPIFNFNDPLDFEARKFMVQEAFPDVLIAYIQNQMEDEVWSAKLDEQINTLTGPNQSVVLYGGRDSFLDAYKGRYDSLELVQDHWVSGSELRSMVKNKVKQCQPFRHGVIWGSYQQYPTVYTTVDIAVTKGDPEDGQKDRWLLLARKPNESKWRFPGGFADPSDESNEAAANRELAEEVPGMEVHPITKDNYLGSYNIDDWRYRHSKDTIRTSFYHTTYMFGNPTPADDIKEVRWFEIADIKEDDVVQNHRELLKVLLDDLNYKEGCVLSCRYI
jgi:bifunctional NMN adenylyltransferase/nudix hydrolase